MTRHDIICGDCLTTLRDMEACSVHCCVTSPPYWGLRDYGTATWEGGDETCDHVAQTMRTRESLAARSAENAAGGGHAVPESVQYRDICGKCGARRIDQQIGLEATPEEYVARMVEVFREVRRVLRDDGTLWLNLGDSYNGVGGPGKQDGGPVGPTAATAIENTRGRHVNRLKPKDLCGIPWRVAFALQADGWVLRQEIIWAKLNPMPESVRDRCTKSHEQIFLFAKAKWSGPPPGRFAHISEADARWLALCIDTEGCIVIKRVKQKDGGADSFGPQVSFGSTSVELMERFSSIVGYGNVLERPGKNAPMWYWQVANKVARDFLKRIYPYLIVKHRQARIGIRVDELVYYRGGKFLSRKQRTEAENDQLSSLWARCKECNRFGRPDLSDVPEPSIGRWTGCQRYYYDAEAIKEEARNWGERDRTNWKARDPRHNTRRPHMGGERGDFEESGRNKRSVWTVTTKPYKAAHFATFPPKLIEPCILAGCPEGGTVLDPFNGSGTTGAVCQQLGRSSIGIELNPSYCQLAKKRLQQPCIF